MPVFSVSVIRRIEESAALEVKAKNAATAAEKVEQLIGTKTWEELTKGVDIGLDSEEITVEEVSEA